MNTVIVADIGGTNARFSLARLGAERGTLSLSHPREFSSADFNTFSACFSEYLSGLGLPPEQIPTSACFAVAGAVGDECTQLTNLNWSLWPRALCQQFGLECAEVINDFAALACATPYLKGADILTLQRGNISSSAAGQLGARAVVGPGTGLGMSALIHDGRRWRPLASEGGHCSFSPETAMELELYQQLRSDSGYVSTEQLLCGSGLQNIYRAMSRIHHLPEQPWSPADITEQALKGTCPMALLALNCFCAQLGSVCGDAALTFGARGGVYLAGGILPRLQNFLLHSDFIERFNNKGKLRGFVEQLDVHLITKSNPGLLGAAAYMLDGSSERLRNDEQINKRQALMESI